MPAQTPSWRLYVRDAYIIFKDDLFRSYRSWRALSTLLLCVSGMATIAIFCVKNADNLRTSLGRQATDLLPVSLLDEEDSKIMRIYLYLTQDREAARAMLAVPFVA